MLASTQLADPGIFMFSPKSYCVCVSNLLDVWKLKHDQIILNHIRTL